MPFTFPQLKAIVRTYANKGDFEPMLDEAFTTPHQKRLLAKLRERSYSVWTEGNAKLPFLSFSGLPGEGVCPGAGECLQFCYSFRSWRNTAPFMRQFQNSLLLDTVQGRRKIVNDLDAALNKRKFQKIVKDGKHVDVRLYVDGDFRNTGEIRFWMRVLAERPHVRAYCYSKSLHLFKALSEQGFKFPPNFMLNLSTGGVHDGLHDSMQALPFVRGRFAAGPVHASPLKLDKAQKRVLTTWAKQEYGGKAVVCPGKCGDCTSAGHICGLNTFKGYTVVIPKH